MNSTESNTQREADATQLADELGLNQDAEFFNDPSNRLAFIESLDADEFFGIAQHINARMRGMEPRDRLTVGEEGAALPLLGTPDPADKPAAFKAGFDAMKSYLATTPDSVEQKAQGVGMATEALIIWVHPFNDGNGRTSRFLGKFIEVGTVDNDALITETASSAERARSYGSEFRIDQANTTKGLDLILDDDEIEAIRKTEMPVDQGIALSITRFLEDKSLQEQVIKKAEYHKDWRAQHLAHLAVAS